MSEGSLRPAAARVQALLKEMGLEAEVVEFAETTRTSAEAAAQIGCDTAQIAKSLVFRAKGSNRPVLVIATIHIATAIIAAYRSVGFNVPLVVRLEGTEVEQGRKMLAESKLNIIAADGLTDGAQKVVAAAKK